MTWSAVTSVTCGPVPTRPRASVGCVPPAGGPVAPSARRGVPPGPAPPSADGHVASTAPHPPGRADGPAEAGPDAPGASGSASLCVRGSSVPGASRPGGVGSRLGEWPGPPTSSTAPPAAGAARRPTWRPAGRCRDRRGPPDPPARAALRRSGRRRCARTAPAATCAISRPASTPSADRSQAVKPGSHSSSTDRQSACESSWQSTPIEPMVTR
jgi:hypothetical protein